MTFSFWEKEVFVNPCDVLIIGSGIVGLNAAIELKELSPGLDVLLVDRGILPSGASTRNAGFACFGSVSELTEDLTHHNADSVAGTLRMRWSGLGMLRSIVPDTYMDYKPSGGIEIFENEPDFKEYARKSDELNNWIETLTGLKDTYQIQESIPAECNFRELYGAIVNRHEGVLHPGKMIQFLLAKATKLGVRFLFGAELSKLEEEQQSVSCYLGDYPLKARYVLLATNGFTGRFYQHLDLMPARNLVLMTSELEQTLPYDAGFHMNSGYVYWRNIDNRILIGGGRNLDIAGESTSEFGTPGLIYEYLYGLLERHILPEQQIRIEDCWSGIMGVGSIKKPIIRMQSERIGMAVRMGGMGIAIGSLVGIEAAKMIRSRV